ncbi:hypothetical protein K438DRAFT_860167 [Mycena galopus ATCC 62051]|nr:hypothetical protein K438DRAFT_860167 [Mycena galopus ATCC 62051]
MTSERFALTEEWLNLHKKHKGYSGLEVKDLYTIIRLHTGNSGQPIGGKKYPDAVEDVLGWVNHPQELKKLRVSWNYIVSGEGEGTAVDQCLRDFFQKGNITPPLLPGSSIVINSSPLSSAPPNNDQDPELEKRKAERPAERPNAEGEKENPDNGQEDQMPVNPPPRPLAKWWGGSHAEFSSDRHVLWPFLKHDPDCDVKKYNFSIVVINQLGDDLNEMTIH